MSRGRVKESGLTRAGMGTGLAPRAPDSGTS